jgi:hypothetical protein
MAAELPNRLTITTQALSLPHTLHPVFSLLLFDEPPSAHKPLLDAELCNGKHFGRTTPLTAWLAT